MLPVVFGPSPADTSRMLHLFEAGLIALLALVAFELYMIHRDLTRLLSRSPMPVDEGAVKGQTINVNVGTPLAGEVRPVDQKAIGPADGIVQPGPEVEPAPDEETLAAMQEERAADLRDAPPPRPVDRTPIVMGLRATESGLIAKKCAKCGSENSSYRSECFNCGANL